MAQSRHEVTGLLRRVANGDVAHAERLFLLVRDELRSSAVRRLRDRGAHGLLLQPTVLVHDAFLKLTAQAGADWCNRDQFFACASEAMRRMVVDWARSDRAGKRDRRRREPLLEDFAAGREHSAAAILDLHEALGRLSALHERMAKIVEMRFFGGLDHAQIAEVLGIAIRTVEKDWHFARAWLHRELSR